MNKINEETKKEESGEYFDDCLICQATKKAEETGEDLTIEEMEKIFAKQNLKNKQSFSTSKQSFSANKPKK